MPPGAASRPRRRRSATRPSAVFFPPPRFAPAPALFFPPPRFAPAPALFFPPPRSACPAPALWSWRRLRDAEAGRGGAGLDQLESAAPDPLQGHGGAVHLLPCDQGRLVHQMQAARVQRA